MARSDPEKCFKRAAKAWAVKDQWRNQLRDAYALAMPMRNNYDNPREGQVKGDRVFDSTLQNSTGRFANRLQTDMTPPFQKWAAFVPGPLVPPDMKDKVGTILQGMRDAFFAALSTSTFDSACNEFYLDLAVTTACMMVLEGDDDTPIRYVTVPQAQVAYDEGPWGEPWGVFRKHKLSVRVIADTWPDFKPPSGWDKLEQDDPDKELEITEATYYDPKERRWYYDVMFKGGVGGQRGVPKGIQRVVEREYDDSPWIITRWTKVAGERYSRGPVLTALPDAKVLNKLKELLLKNASLSVAGVWTAVDDGVLNPNVISITPGKVIKVARNAGAQGPSLQQLEFKGRVDLSQIAVEELTASIKKAMYDNQLPPDAGPVRSATELVMRMKELSQDVGAPFGRMMSEFIRPLVQKSLNILARKGVIQLGPGGRIKVDGAAVDVQITSPLAQAQNLSEVQTAMQWISLCQALGQEIAMLGIKVEDVPNWLAEKLGVAKQIVRTSDERIRIQATVAQLVKTQMAAQVKPANQNTSAPPGVVPGSGGVPQGGEQLAA